MDMIPWHLWAGIGLLGVAQGFLNTVAGGGTLLVLPALTFLGLDLAVANGTNRVSILLQSVSGAASFRSRKALSFREAAPLALAATLGAVLGVLVVIRIDRRALHLAVACLISIMALLLVVRPGMWETRRPRPWRPAALRALCFAIGFYGGFLQAGVGFFFSWALVAAGGMDLVRGNALKTVIIGCYTAVSLVLFLAGGLVHLPIGLALAAGSMVGAHLGARFTLARGNRWVRRILAATVVASAMKMAWDALR